MSDGKIIYDVEVNDDGVESKVRQTNDKIDSAAQTGSGAFSEVWTGALRAIGGKLVELGERAVEAAVDVAKESLAQVAAFEQNVGGIEKLFGESAGIVQENAKNAFKTAGLSANEYMENVTGFAASLVSSLGGDTELAATYADLAIQAMSDNANTFGTDMSAIMTTYQGFAKQNYSMLDNLKLGYGGTKTEMERLMRDAEEMEGYIEGSLSIDSFADVTEAIQIVQENLNIAGTTAREAAGTIEGSMASMKAAWTNFLTGTMDGREFAETAIIAAENVVNALMDIIPRLIQGFAEMTPVLLEKAKELVIHIATGISEHLPEFYEKGAEMMRKIGDGLKEKIPEFLENALPMVLQFTQKLRENVGKYVEAGIEMITKLVQGIAASLPTLIKYVPTIISNVVGILNDNMPKILAAGVNLIKIMLQGIVEAIPTLIAEFPKIVQMIFDIIQAVDWLNLGKFLINGILNGITALMSAIPNLVKNIGESAFNFFKSINWGQLGANLINAILGIIKGNFELIPNALRNVAANAYNAFTSINWYNLGANIIQGAINGIRENVGAIASAARNAAQAAFQAAKDFLGISSPSKQFALIGEYSDEGQAKGMLDNVGIVENASQEVAERALDAQMNVDYDLPDIDSASRDMSANLASSFTSTVTRIIEIPLNIDAREIARATAWDMGEQLAWEMR